MTDKSKKGGKTLNKPQRKRAPTKIPEGAFDTELVQPATIISTTGPASEPVNDNVEHQKAQVETSVPPRVKAPEHPYRAPFPFDTTEDKLELPDDGLVAMRKSGGLRFTSSTVTVYHDGRVAREPDSAFGAPSHPQAHKLSDRDLAELYRALDKANFPRLDPIPGHQSPDAYAYELATRIGSTTYRAEVFDGSIPEQLSALITLLAKYSKSTP